MYQEYILNDKKLLSELSDLIKGFTANGMEMLIMRLKYKESLKTDLATNLLFRQTLEMSDAIQELIKVGCVNASKPLLRSLLEFYFQLAYLLKDNEERKALQFLYHYHIRQKDYYKKLAFPKADGSFFQKLKKDKHLKGMDIGQNQKKVYLENLQKIETILNGEDYIEIAKEYEQAEIRKSNKSGKKGKVSYWYELFEGPTSIEIVAIELDEAALYELIYRECSTYAHGENIVHTNLESLSDDTMGISALRDLRQLDVVGNNVVLLIERCCMLFLKHKIEEKKDLANKFLPFVLKAKELRETAK